ncbi:dihydrodipicolinate synthase family protein [uncultured Nitratireductor sp.]|uniref:dihydrodipicolinate synthase family protein n=1 Tax=uncultured Nitratireductor sp. TaxID=520953 RepID=UPI0025EC31E8|nr:dihydrodipicolinate synthase family protein [uncultured Nitratireductor sp.]
MTLRGIFPVLPSPFDQNGDCDASAMVRLVDFAAACGVQGMVFPGFASEVSELSADERQLLLSTVVKAAPEAMPVVAGASAESVEAVVEYGQAARSLGVRHLMIQPPTKIGNAAAAVVEFMGAVASALPTMEIILQNAPAPRGSDIAPEAIVFVARVIPQVTYVKEETLPAGPAITHILSNAPDTLKGVIGGGGARYILDEYGRGACAAMPALEIADFHVALDDAWRSGETAEARDVYVRTLPLLTLQALYRMRLTKHVLMRRGVLHNASVRARTPQLDKHAIADIDANLAELDIVSGSQNARSAAE